MIPNGKASFVDCCSGLRFEVWPACFGDLNYLEQCGAPNVMILVGFGVVLWPGYSPRSRALGLARVAQSRPQQRVSICCDLVY